MDVVAVVDVVDCLAPSHVFLHQLPLLHHVSVSPVEILQILCELYRCFRVRVLVVRLAGKQNTIL